MVLSVQDKEQIKRELVERLKGEPEVRRIVVFGSFATSPDPHDLNVAVFQDSDRTYLPLAMKCRRPTRPIARRIPMDILPIHKDGGPGWFMDEIRRGEVIYEH